MFLLLRFLLLFYPIFCLGCHECGAWICSKCFLKIKKVSHQVCPISYKYSPQGKVLVKRRSFYLDGLIVVAPYNGNIFLIRLIKRLKYFFAFDIAPVLGKLMQQTLQEENVNMKEYAIVPVPLHWRRMFYRGFNQSALLALSLGKVEILLRRIRFTEPQVSLPKEERLKNIQDAFATKKGIHIPEKVLLIDDVSSTLATLNECAKVLKQAGVREVLGVVLARNN